MEPYNEIVNIVTKLIPTTMVLYLFGSRARGSSSSQSDFDLAVLCGDKLSDCEKMTVIQELGLGINAEIDLIDLLGASDVMKAQVLDGAMVLFCNNELVKDEFEMYALSDYARLNESRREILEQFYGKEVLRD